MANTSNSIANQALYLVGDNIPAVSGFAPTFDSSTAGQALQVLYAPTVAACQRQFSWDASRRQVTLTATGNTAPFLGGQYDFEYLYPGNGIEVWEVLPAVITDRNDPLPFNYTIGNTLVGGVQTKVIWSEVQAAIAIYNNNPTEATWDALFVEFVVRELASKLAEAIAGKPETSALMGQTAQQAAAMNAGRGG